MCVMGWNAPATFRRIKKKKGRYILADGQSQWYDIIFSMGLPFTLSFRMRSI